MNRVTVNLILVLSIFTSSFSTAYARDMASCEDLFVSAPKLATPVSLQDKLNYIDLGIRSRTQNAFKGMDLFDRNLKKQQRLNRYLERVDFDKITMNQLVIIQGRLHKLPLSVVQQLKLMMTGKSYLAEEDFNTTKISNDLINFGLIEFVKESGNLQDRDIRDHYQVYLKKYLPMIRLVFTSAYTLFSLFDTAAVLGNVKSLFNRKFNFVNFNVLPDEYQENIFLNGILDTKSATLEGFGGRSKFAVHYQVTTKIVNTVFTLIALAFLVDELSRRYLGVTPKNLFDDMVHRGDLEKMATAAIIATMVESGESYDEDIIRAQVHRMNLKMIEEEINAQ